MIIQVEGTKNYRLGAAIVWLHFYILPPGLHSRIFIAVSQSVQRNISTGMDIKNAGSFKGCIVVPHGCFIIIFCVKK